VGKPRGWLFGRPAGNLLEDQPTAEKGAAQDRHQGETIHGLGDEIEGASGDALLGGFFVCITRHDNHRGLKPLAPDEPQDLRASTPGHYEVTDDRVESLFGRESLDGGRGALRHQDVYGQWLEVVAENLLLANFIIHYENATLGHRSSRPLL
jgi:hypothetical protein